MGVKEIRTALLEDLEAEAAAHGIDIVDVELAGSSRAPIVRVRIDHEDATAEPITLDEVAANNAWIEALIEEADPFPGAYTLEVSSPGLDRPLRRPKDFLRFVGERAQVQTTATEGRRKYTGEIVGFEDGEALLSCDGEQVAIALDQIKSAKLKPTFDAPGKAG